MNGMILASGSPRRRELLAGLGWNFTIVPSLIDEKEAAGESPDCLVRRLADEKASDVAARFPGNWVLGADTVVAVDGRILGKPRGEAESAAMITELSGRTHSVFTGVALLAPDGRKLIRAEETRVTFRPLSEADVAAYIAQGESLDKAGAYAIQGKGMRFIRGIEGDFYTVMGLPAARLWHFAAEKGILPEGTEIFV